jgi:hypothetical protein
MEVDLYVADVPTLAYNPAFAGVTCPIFVRNIPVITAALVCYAVGSL